MKQAVPVAKAPSLRFLASPLHRGTPILDENPEGGNETFLVRGAALLHHHVRLLLHHFLDELVQAGPGILQGEITEALRGAKVSLS